LAHGRRTLPSHLLFLILGISNVGAAGDKIVDGKAVTMGVDDWSYDAISQTLIYEIPRGTWKLIVDGDEMNGTLITRDNVLLRKVHVHRSKMRN
jgi:hypothetical protein